MTTTSKAPVLSSEGLQPFFKDLVTTAASNQGVALEEVTEFYVVNLLAEFATSQRLFERRDGGRTHEPLALIWARAMESSPDARIPILKRLGDVSLYVSGFFHDSLARTMVDVDYYIGMGRAAYSTIAGYMGATSRRDVFSELYQQLADQFAALVDVLGEVSECSAFKGREHDVLRLYERYLKTGSARLASKLAAMGVIPTENARSGLLH